MILKLWQITWVISMKKFIKDTFGIFLLAIFTISISAEYRLGRDYSIVDNPLPVKKDGIVEVIELFGMAVEVATLSLQLMTGLQNKDQM